MERERFELVRRKLVNLISNVEKLADGGRRQERSFLGNHFIYVINLMEEVYALPEIEERLNDILSNLTLIMTALEGNDYVLLTDYTVEFILNPLKQLAEDWVAGKEVLNLPLSHYNLEYTSTGAVTIAKCLENKNIYLHSNLSPTEEALNLSNKWMKNGIGKYIVAGLGFGYHIGELYRQTGAEIYVFEEDLEMIELARQYSDWNWIFDEKHIHIVPDSGYAKFGAEVVKAENEPEDFVTGSSSTEVCLYYPALTSIQDEKLRDNMLRIFLQKDNAARWMNHLLMNISHNVRLVNHYSSELKTVFKGKRVYIIAGGPSLDKNLHLLKERKDGEIVITVGTSLKKCVGDGIAPDYVITTDPKPACSYQFDGMYDCGVPMILLSTAYREVIEAYQGEKYILFQEGLAVAEKIARQKGEPLFSSGGSVATTALDFCIRMEVREIVFLGLDLANTGGKSHHSGTAERRDTTNESSLWVEDIYGNPVQTSKAFDGYRTWIEEKIQKARVDSVDIRFIDATEGGAKVAGTEILTLAEVMK